jgi:hypothetical protein
VVTVDRLKNHTGTSTEMPAVLLHMGAATRGKAPGTSITPQPSQEDTFPRPASNYKH